MGTLRVDLRTDHPRASIESIDVHAVHVDDPAANRYARIDDPTGDLERGIRLATFEGVDNDQRYDVDVRILLRRGDPCIARRTLAIETEKRTCRRFLFFRYSCRTPTTQVDAVISRPMG